MSDKLAVFRCKDDKWSMQLSGGHGGIKPNCYVVNKSL